MRRVYEITKKQKPKPTQTRFQGQYGRDAQGREVRRKAAGEQAAREEDVEKPAGLDQKATGVDQKRAGLDPSGEGLSPVQLGRRGRRRE